MIYLNIVDRSCAPRQGRKAEPWTGSAEWEPRTNHANLSICRPPSRRITSLYPTYLSTNHLAT